MSTGDPSGRLETNIPLAWTARLDNPWAVVAIALTLYTLFVGLRLHKLNYDVSRFVLAGDEFCAPAEVPAGLSVRAGSSGYDGQYYYRLALDPLTSRVRDFGITLDMPAYRQQRIGYPLLARLVACGRPEYVPTAMLLVNLAGIGGIAYFAAACVHSMGRHALLALLVAGYPGLVLTLARDLAEIVEVCFLLAGLLAFRRGRGLPAGLALAAAVLCKETALLAVAALALPPSVFRLGLALRNATATRAGLAACGELELRPGIEPRYSGDEPVAADPSANGDAARRTGFTAMAVALTPPIVVFAAWQWFLRGRWGVFPVMAGESNIGPPFLGLVAFVQRVLASAGSGVFDYWLGILVFLAVFTACVFFALRTTRAGSEVVVGWLLYGGLGLSLTDVVWVEHWAFLRALTEFYVLGALALAGSRLRVLPVYAVYAGFAWFAVMRASRGV